MELALLNTADDSQKQPEQESLITREGKEVNISGDIWRLPYSARGNATLNFENIVNNQVRAALKIHIADRLRRVLRMRGMRRIRIFGGKS